MLTKAFVKTQLFIESFKNDERGVTAIEYAILGVCMSAIVLAVFNGSLKTALDSAIAAITRNINTASGIK
ncbi:Flp family type IVb pilin [Vibrio ouci]|uniref:Flp family type IVb pilin n=1 Tax=Vibrio ouci TaxID=2499078 RepID=A0A4Y8WE60_9VIBR|nr:Flp family type IVb pilin [Vibrio ouci]TFH90905.1 Flp family type IVb pilin [Vibrio ouci]